MILGLVATLALFLLMHTLIATADRTVDESAATKIADITMSETRIETNIKEQKPEKVEDPEEPPPPLDQPNVQEFDSASRIAVNMSATPKQEVKLSSGLGISAVRRRIPADRQGCRDLSAPGTDARHHRLLHRGVHRDRDRSDP